MHRVAVKSVEDAACCTTHLDDTSAAQPAAEGQALHVLWNSAPRTVIGSGKNAVVYSAVTDTGAPVAVKVFKKASGEDTATRWAAISSILRGLRTDADELAVLVMRHSAASELPPEAAVTLQASSESLLSVLDRTADPSARAMLAVAACRQTAAALSALHAARFLHGNVHYRRVLLHQVPQGHLGSTAAAASSSPLTAKPVVCRLAGLECATPVEGGGSAALGGTFSTRNGYAVVNNIQCTDAFSSPELLVARHAQEQRGSMQTLELRNPLTVDVWAWGVLLHVCVTGVFPFARACEGDVHFDAFLRFSGQVPAVAALHYAMGVPHKHQVPAPGKWGWHSALSPALRNILRACWCVRPSERCTIDEVLAACAAEDTKNASWCQCSRVESSRSSVSSAQLPSVEPREEATQSLHMSRLTGQLQASEACSALTLHTSSNSIDSDAPQRAVCCACM